MRYTIIGASAAGIKAAGLLRQKDPTAKITIVSRDKDVYSRCMLHLRLMGERDEAGISFIDAGFFTDNNIQWRNGETVAEILVDEHALLLESGKKVGYDKLLIASGASSTIPPIPNLREAKNVSTLRTIDDVHKLAAWGKPNTRAVIIGAGLVGMDAAVALLEMGVKTTLVEMAHRVLAIQLDDYSAARYADLLVKHGAEVIVGAKVKGAVSDGCGGVKAIQLADGKELPCDFCVVAAGVSPNIGFIKDPRIKLTDNKLAVAVDRRCRTSVPEIYAAGDVTFLAPIWPEAIRQAEVAADNMLGGDSTLPEQDWSWTNSMNFFGLPTISYGRTSMADPSYVQETFVDGDVYKKVIHKNGILYGAIFQGDIDNCGVYLRLVRDGIPFDKTGKPPLKLSYADFFEQKSNGEFV